jgi:hypothetical protein
MPLELFSARRPPASQPRSREGALFEPGHSVSSSFAQAIQTFQLF